MAASHNHLCLCGPPQIVPFGWGEGFAVCLGSGRAPKRAAGAEGAPLGFGVFLSPFPPAEIHSSCRIPLECHSAVHEGDFLGGQVGSAGPGNGPFLKDCCRQMYLGNRLM